MHQKICDQRIRCKIRSGRYICDGNKGQASTKSKDVYGKHRETQGYQGSFSQPSPSHETVPRPIWGYFGFRPFGGRGAISILDSLPNVFYLRGLFGNVFSLASLAKSFTTTLPKKLSDPKIKGTWCFLECLCVPSSKQWSTQRTWWMVPFPGTHLWKVLSIGKRASKLNTALLLANCVCMERNKKLCPNLWTIAGLSHGQQMV